MSKKKPNPVAKRGPEQEKFLNAIKESAEKIVADCATLASRTYFPADSTWLSELKHKMQWISSSLGGLATKKDNEKFQVDVYYGAPDYGSLAGVAEMFGRATQYWNGQLDLWAEYEKERIWDEIEAMNGYLARCENGRDTSDRITLR